MTAVVMASFWDRVGPAASRICEHLLNDRPRN
jgi:hypothetical protein